MTVGNEAKNENLFSLLASEPTGQSASSAKLKFFFKRI